MLSARNPSIAGACELSRLCTFRSAFRKLALGVTTFRDLAKNGIEQAHVSSPL